jgi:hypothetical protein
MSKLFDYGFSPIAFLLNIAGARNEDADGFDSFSCHGVSNRGEFFVENSPSV